MISLNTYSFGLGMGLAKGSKKTMKFLDFINFCSKNKIKTIEFPLDFFSKQEKKEINYYFRILKKHNFKAIIDLEDLNINIIKKLTKISHFYDFDLIRIKMSNHFGGNRYQIKDFEQQKKNFVKLIKKSLMIVKGTKIKFAIENHQDLNSKELINIIKQTSLKKVGINWDIANSLATIETPDEFFKNTKNYIMNVHSKDYKVIKSDKGFFLKRCIIGKGIVNFKRYINFFKKKKINFSIELGAHISRHCDFRNEEFLKSHNLTKNKILNFNKYLNKWHFNESPYSNWQIKKNLNFSYKEEISDIIASINFVKKIYGKQ